MQTWSSPKSAAPPAISKASLFMEAIRQVSLEVGRENCLFIHVTLVPYILKGSGEHKIKADPAFGAGNCRAWAYAQTSSSPGATNRWKMNIKRKISLFCNVKPDCVIENRTMPGTI